MPAAVNYATPLSYPTRTFTHPHAGSEAACDACERVEVQRAASGEAGGGRRAEERAGGAAQHSQLAAGSGGYHLQGSTGSFINQ
jgi:hypothetical protein